MENSIHNKLLKMRLVLQKVEVKDFDGLVALITQKAKIYKVLPLYCFYDNKAVLTLIDLEDVNSQIKITAPAEISIKSVKQYLYEMAFEVKCLQEYITAKQYVELLERIKTLGVAEKDILERYQLKNLTDMTTDIYKRCSSVLDQMTKK